jgi:hypothetical protein
MNVPLAQTGARMKNTYPQSSQIFAEEETYRETLFRTREIQFRDTFSKEAKNG